MLDCGDGFNHFDSSLTADKTAKGKAEKRYADAQKMLEELIEFVDKVNAIAYQGPPPADDKPKKSFFGRLFGGKKEKK